MEQISKGPAHQAYILLKIVFVLTPVIAGLDKYFDLLVDWDKYLAPIWGSFGEELMLVAGGVEIAAGLGVLIRPKIFSYVVGLWLVGIILNLLVLGNYYDIAFRDLGLCLSAFAFARLAKVYG